MRYFSLPLHRYALGLLGIMVLAGCTTVGPDFKTPDAPAVERYLQGERPARTASADVGQGAHKAWKPARPSRPSGGRHSARPGSTRW